MSLLNRHRRVGRKSWCLNAGFIYGAASGLAYVAGKNFKYPAGDRDLPWAILIVLLGGVVGGVLWQMARALFGSGGGAGKDRGGANRGETSG